MTEIQTIHICEIPKSVTPPTRILIMAWGTVTTSAQGAFLVDAAAAQSVLDVFEKRHIDLVIDAEHQSLGGKYSSPDGTAPAMGWIKSLEAVEGEGIYANVEWTPRGADLVRDRSYRYLSPVLIAHKESGRVMRLLSVALTNVPAMDRAKPIVNSLTHMEVHTMDSLVEKMRWWLNLPESSTPDEILSEMTKFMDNARAEAGATVTANSLELLKSIRALKDKAAIPEPVAKLLGVPSTSDTVTINTAVNALSSKLATSPSDAIPAAEFKALKDSYEKSESENAEMRKVLSERLAQERIDAAMATGQLTEGMLEPDADGSNHFRKLALSETEWSAWLRRAPKVAPERGRVVAGRTGDTPSGDRTQIMINAAREHRDNPQLAALCSRQNYVDQVLREARMPESTPAEVAALKA